MGGLRKQVQLRHGSVLPPCSRIPFPSCKTIHRYLHDRFLCLARPHRRPHRRLPLPAVQHGRQATRHGGRPLSLAADAASGSGDPSPAGSWARMFSESLVGRKDWYSSRCALIWKLKVTASSRTYFQLAVSMRRTGGTGRGSSPILPTVQTQGLKICRNGRMEPLPLNLLPTPTVSDATIGSVISSKDRYVATSTGIWRKIDGRGANWSLGLSKMSLLHLLPEPRSERICSTARRHGGIPDWDDFPTQPPVRRGDDGLSERLDPAAVFAGLDRKHKRRSHVARWCAEAIKCYGNAIVPQVAYRILTTIYRYESRIAE